MKVLVADDSQPIRERLIDRLSRLPDVKVAEAVDTPDALRQMETFKPDVAVLDIRMPGGGGIKALTEIKKNYPGTTVMVMTNYPYAQYRHKCLDAGADFFFDKSSEFEQVAETIRQLTQALNVGEVALRTASAQLVAAKEHLEKIEQRQRDMDLLSLLQKPDESNGFNQAYVMWEKTFDAMPDLVSIFDTNHCIIRVNKAMADRVGVPAAELTGKKCFEYCHGTTCPVDGCPHEAMLKDGRAHTAELYEKHLGGWFNVSVSPIYEAGRLIGVIHVAHDITRRKRAEALAQSTLDALSAHIAIVDEEGAVLAVNRSWAQFAEKNHLLHGAGAGANYLAVCDASQGAHASDAKRFAEGLRAVLQGRSELFEMEYSCETESEQFWFCGRVTSFPGEGLRMAAIAHEDITARKQAENAVRQSELNLRYVISAMNDGLWDWDIANDTIKYSPQWYRMLGYEPDERSINQRRLEELMHPDDIAVREEALRAYFCGETDIYNAEFRIQRKDGTYAWIWTRGSLIERNAEGEPSRMMGVHSDITARREAAQALEASELRYRQLFDSMQSGFALHEIICDGQGVPCDYRFLEINPAFEALTGLKEERLIGRTIKEVLPATESRWIDIYGKVALTGKPVRIDDFSGTLGRHYSVSAYSPRKGQFATIFSDITEQKNAEAAVRLARDAAEASNLAKTQFLANMSHELRTPLNAIIGLTELLEDSKLDEEQRDYIHTIGASGEALLALVADLLDLSRIEMGKIELKNELFNIRELVGKAVALISLQAAKKGLELTCGFEESVPEQITSDPARLQQVLVNLLNNALKFTEKGFVRLTVSGRLTPGGSRFVEFSIEDSGEGIDASAMKRIFQPFQQGDSSTTRAHGGAGLGLPISRNLVKMMGGTIHVKSSTGKGSTFSFNIIDQTVPKNQVAADEVRGQWRSRCICVWGDDPADLRTIEHLLERCGIMPRYAESMDAVLDRLTNEIPADAVLCDLDMPGLAARLPEFRKIRPEVPWIAFSSWEASFDEQVINCFSAFIDRPLRPEQLYGALLQIAADAPGISSTEGCSR